jgi:hypothetical protein
LPGQFSVTINTLITARCCHLLGIHQGTAGCNPFLQVGHNGGPTTALFGLHAAWLRFADELELRRVAKLHLRIERKKASMKVLVGERQRIMNRCIRRMRRNQGKA